MNFIFPYIGNVIIPIDSYFSDGLKPPTSEKVFLESLERFIEISSMKRFSMKKSLKWPLKRFLYVYHAIDWVIL